LGAKPLIADKKLMPKRTVLGSAMAGAEKALRAKHPFVTQKTVTGRKVAVEKSRPVISMPGN